MGIDQLASYLGQRKFLPGHFDVPVVLEDARQLGSADSAGYECHVRLPDGSLDKTVISAEEDVAARFYEIPAEAIASAVLGAEERKNS